MRSPSARRAVGALLVAVGLSVTTAGCVSMPSAGPVLSYTNTQGSSTQGQAYLQLVPPSPAQDESPSEIVQGFLSAGASFVGQQQVARTYLTPAASRQWQPGWTTVVFKDGPSVVGDPQPPGPKQDTTTITVGGYVQATLNGKGTYAVASETPKNGTTTFRYDLVRDRHGQWRISNAHGNPLLLTGPEFEADYQVRNLYFFDPSNQHLVPDPVYVPLQASQGDLVNVLVRDLITQPRDWLGKNDATHTQFPGKTTLLQSVTVDGGTAAVDLGGPVAHAPVGVKEQISAQLWWTLRGAGQGQQQVQSVALSLNGRAFVPPGGTPGNPVQNQATQFRPATGPEAPGYYYLKPNGQLWKGGTTGGEARVASVGKGYTSLAISPDGQFFAALKGGSVYSGTVSSGKLAPRNAGDGVTSLSWDRYDNLWAVGGSGVVTLLATPGRVTGPPTTVTLDGHPTCTGGDPGDITALRVAPDGVRVAVAFGGQQATLAFGALTRQDQSQPGQAPPLVTIGWSPFFVCGEATPAFRSLSWWGADNVIALGQPGGTLTRYPVNGGTPMTIPGRSGIRAITASEGGGLIASMDDNSMSLDPGATGLWNRPFPGLSPAFPG